MVNEDISVALYRLIKEDEQPRVYEHWHVSSLAQCPRSHYLARLGTPPINKPTGAKILRWSSGHLMEEKIRPYVDKYFGGVQSNYRMTSEKLDLTGEFDNYSEELETLIEIKTVSDYAFFEENGVVGLKEENGTYINNRGREVKRYRLKTTPYLHHQIQQHGYKILLAEENKKVSRIVYVYLSLGGRVVVYDTKPDETIENQLIKRLSVLQEAWERKEPPPCICTKQDHPLYGPVMQWCDYRTEDGCCEIM